MVRYLNKLKQTWNLKLRLAYEKTSIESFLASLLKYNLNSDYDYGFSKFKESLISFTPSNEG